MAGGADVSYYADYDEAPFRWQPVIDGKTRPRYGDPSFVALWGTEAADPER